MRYDRLVITDIMTWRTLQTVIYLQNNRHEYTYTVEDTSQENPVTSDVTSNPQKAKAITIYILNFHPTPDEQYVDGLSATPSNSIFNIHIKFYLQEKG
ncbi:hypothetical protein BaRGS_00006179 [Batillaria attramentaria]|uniref:Uncharacterized protein n=1 Tax=Batillaria attramentaria TaxID=370345 RepID=A0ABD0LSS6_9CAEN